MKILFCYDGSSQAENAVRFGVQIAAACQAESSILAVTVKAEDENALRNAARHVQDVFKEHGIAAELITRVGRPTRAIVKQTEEAHYDLVVIGVMSNDTPWRLFAPVWMSMGARDIVELVEPAVLVVIGGRRALHRILLCTGGSEYIAKATEIVGRIARCVNATVDLAHVLPEPPAMYADLVLYEEDADQVLKSSSKLGRALRRQKSLLERFGVFGELRLRQGQVVPELLKELKRTEYDLVVSGSLPAREKLRKYVMGDVARQRSEERRVGKECRSRWSPYH